MSVQFLAQWIFSVWSCTRAFPEPGMCFRFYGDPSVSVVIGDDSSLFDQSVEKMAFNDTSSLICIDDSNQHPPALPLIFKPGFPRKTGMSKELKTVL